MEPITPTRSARESAAVGDMAPSINGVDEQQDDDASAEEVCEGDADVEEDVDDEECVRADAVDESERERLSG